MITPIYTALLALVFVVLSVRTLRLRRSLRIGVGTGENELMLRAMRVHSNFAEYTPIALILAFMLEGQLENSDWGAFLIHFVCGSLLLGRILHAYGVSQIKEKFIFRVSGMAFTFTSICTSAIAILVVSL